MNATRPRRITLIFLKIFLNVFEMRFSSSSSSFSRVACFSESIFENERNRSSLFRVKSKHREFWFYPFGINKTSCKIRRFFSIICTRLKSLQDGIIDDHKIEIIRNIDFIERQIGLFSVINRYDLGCSILNHYSNNIFYSKILVVICSLKILGKKNITCETLLSLIVNRSVWKIDIRNFLYFTKGLV